VDFVKAGFVDAEEDLVNNLNRSQMFAQHFLLAQFSFFAVSFEPLEFKKLGLHNSLPFVLDSQTSTRKGGYGMVEKVFEGKKPFARKTIRDNYDEYFTLGY
jgi:hypothetical protein